MFNVKKDMSPLNYALQYEMSKKLSKLLYTVDDDIMSVEPLIGDSNYNSIATVKRNGKITRVKYNRKKMDDTLNEVCLTKRKDTNGNYSHVYLTPLTAPEAGDNLPDDWDAEKTKDYLKSYGLTWDRSMGGVMDTDNKVFNMVGNRNPVGVFDVAKDIINLDDNAYVIRNVENTQPFGVVAIKYGEQISFKVPFDSTYAHQMFISNGTIYKKIGLDNSEDIDDQKLIRILGTGARYEYISHNWTQSGLGDNFKPVILNDSTVTYTVRYDDNGVNVSMTDDTRTTPIDNYELLTDKVFICLMFMYNDMVPSPTSRPEINLTVNKQTIESLPEFSTVKFPLSRRLAYGNYEYDSNGSPIPTPYGWNNSSKSCIFGYANRPGLNRLKFITEMEQAFNSQYVTEVTIGLNNAGMYIDESLPYVKFTKREDGVWDLFRSDKPIPSTMVADADLKNIDVIYNSTQKDFLVYAMTDPNDTSALDTEPAEQTPYTYLLVDNRNFDNSPGDVTIYDFAVKITYANGFDQVPIIKPTRYTPEPSKTSFNFSNAIYTTIGDNNTTHYGSTTYPVSFFNTITYDEINNPKTGRYTITAKAQSIGSTDGFTMESDTNPYMVPRNRRVVITTERINADNLLAGKYQGIVVTYSGVKVDTNDYPYSIVHTKCNIVNTLPTIFSLKDGNDSDAIENSGVDYVAHPITLLGTVVNQKKSYQLLVDLSVTEYFIYDISQDYANYGSDISA